MMSTQTAVVMYGTRICPYCRAARDFLDARGIGYEDIRVDDRPELRTRMRELGGGHTVPQIWIGSRHVGGYTDMLALDREGRLDALFDAQPDSRPDARLDNQEQIDE